MEFEHEETRIIQGFLSDCVKPGIAKTIFQIPFKDDVFGLRHNRFFLRLGRRFKKWFEQITDIRNAEEKPLIREFILDLWASHLHECMQSSNPKRIQFVSASVLRLRSYTDRDAEIENQTRITALFEVMKENPARVYLCPYLQHSHFFLLVIVPEASLIYYFDPAARGIVDNCFFEFFKEITRLYDTKLRNVDDTEERHTWKLIDLPHKTQLGNWECGYYIMLYMEKIVFETKGIDILPPFIRGDGTYRLEEIEAVAHKLCRVIFVRKIFPFCRQQIDSGLRIPATICRKQIDAAGSLIPCATF